MVTLMNAVSNGMDAEFDKSMAMMGQNVVYVEKQPWGGGPNYKWWKNRNRREMKLSYVDQIRQSSELASTVSAAATRGMTLRYEDKSSEGVFMAGVTGRYFDTAGLDMESGRVFTEEEVRRGVKIVILGATLAETFLKKRIHWVNIVGWVDKDFG